jgi:uroporphyrin-3 C-methyltransferase
MTNETSINVDKNLIPCIRPKSSHGFQTVVVVLMMGVLSFTAYTHWSAQTTSQKFAKLLAQLQQQQLNTLQLLKTEHINFETNQINLRTSMDELQKQFYAATTPSTDVSNLWLLLKAQYAIELAQMNAQWSGDEATTYSLLKQADNFLSDNPNASLIPVRQALSHDMLAEKTLPSIDFVSLLSQLDAIQKYLTTYQSNPSKNKQNATSTAESSKASWQTRIKNMLCILKQFFIVQHHTDSIEPLLTPAYRALQKEIIHLNLQEAQWAVLQRNNTIYQLALKQACDNMRRVFGKDDTQSLQLMEQIGKLQSIQIQDIKVVPTESLIALERVIENQTTKKTPPASSNPDQSQEPPLSFGVTP